MIFNSAHAHYVTYFDGVLEGDGGGGVSEPHRLVRGQPPEPLLPHLCEVGALYIE